eukprot:51050_1
MTTGFSIAADWLQNISGPNANSQIEKKDDAHDPVLRDLRAMKDDEIKAGGGTAALSPPRIEERGGRNAAFAAKGASARMQQQPKPKFVAHKDPTRSKKGKDKAKSNRLGNELHMA